MAVPSKKRRAPVSAVQWATLLVVAAFVIVPFYTTALGGFKEIGELRVNPFGLPASWDPVRFVEILGGPRYFSSLGNSLLIALGTVVLSTVVASMTAFALAHIKFFGRNFIMGYLMLGLLFPSATGILPLGIMQFQGQFGSDWPRILAFLTLSIMPAIAFFLLAQRYVISGLTGGAVKG